MSCIATGNNEIDLHPDIDELKAEIETYKKALRQCVKSVLSYEYQQFGSACQDEELFVIHNTQGYIDEYVKKAKEDK